MDKRYRINLKKKEEIEMEEVLSWRQSSLVGDDFLERRIELPISKKPFIFLFCFLFLFLTICFFRVFYFSVLKHQHFLTLAKNNLFRTVSLEAPRGLIYDRNGKPLAKNIPSFSLFLNKKEIDNQSLAKIKKLVNLSQEEWQEIEEKLKKENGIFLLLKRNLSQEEAVNISSNKIKGVYLLTSLKRFYPEGKIFSSIIGYLGEANAEDFKEHPEYLVKEMVGRSGLEKFYQDLLRGKPAKVLIERKEKENPSEIVLEKALPGKDLRLTIDAEMQKLLFSLLEEQIKIIGAKKGLAIVENPQNGEILSLISFPSYDNNAFIERDSQKIKEILTNPDKPLFNRVVAGLYPPGSTIKPFLALAGLEEGIVSPEKVIDDRPGYLLLPNPYSPDKPSIFRDWKIHGLVDLRKAIAVSCDIYFYYLGGGYKNFKGLGIEKIKEYLEKFNLGEKTGIDLPLEKEGLLPDPSWKSKSGRGRWTIGDTYHLSIGQGDLLLTPIALLNSYSALVNGGILYSPHLLFSSEKKIVKKINFSQNNWQEVIKGLLDVTQKPYGTGYYLHDLPIKIAGKSGTAQVKGGRQINSLFLAHFPVEKPEISLLVMIENTKEHQLNVLPVVKKFFLWYYNNRISQKI